MRGEEITFGFKTRSIFYESNGERLKFSLNINERACVYGCVNVVIGRQSDVGALQGVTLVVLSAADG